MNKTTEFAKNAIENIKAKNIITIQIKDAEYIADEMLICTGTSSSHVKAIAKNVVLESKKKKIKILGVEGEQQGEWVLIDFGDTIIHIMLEKTREFYDLEKLWESI